MLKVFRAVSLATEISEYFVRTSCCSLNASAHYLHMKDMKTPRTKLKFPWTVESLKLSENKTGG